MFLGDTCGKLVLLLSYPNSEWEVFVFVLVVQTFKPTACSDPTPAYFILSNFPTTLHIRTPAYWGPKSILIIFIQTIVLRPRTLLKLLSGTVLNDLELQSMCFSYKLLIEVKKDEESFVMFLLDEDC